MQKRECIICIETYDAGIAMYEKFVFLEKLSLKYDIEVFIFHKGALSCNTSTQLNFISFKEVSEILWNLIRYVKEYNILSLQTHNDFFIPKIEKLKKVLGLQSSRWPEVIYNKFLQRELLNKRVPEYGVKAFLTYQNRDIVLDKPYIYKDIIGLDSIWVQKVYPGSSQNFQDKHGMLEEYISGDKYSIDYFVDISWNISYMSPVALGKSWHYVWIDDFFVFLSYMSLENWYIHQNERCINFLSTCVKVLGICNTFIHHEFFIDSSWEYKHIEINGRHGYNRIQMVYETTWYNMLEAYCGVAPLKLPHIPESNYAVIKIYPSWSWILQGFSEDILYTIQELESFLDYSVSMEHVWKEVWLSQHWFSNIWNIKLFSKDKDLINWDIKKIQSLYKEITILV